jgi:hypothetical protein
MSEQPRTYAQALKVAEEVTADEFAALFEANGNYNIDLFRPNCQRRIIFDVTLSVDDNGRGALIYAYCNRGGYGDTAATSVGFRYKRPVIRLDNIGRTVIITPTVGDAIG